MSRRLMVVNVILSGLVIAGVIRLRHDMQAFSAAHQVDQIQPESDKPLPKPVSSPSAANKQDWLDIAAHNPFSFDRNDVAIVVTPPAAQQPKRPKPLLFGTMLLGKDLLALLAPGDSANRSSRPVHTGETFDGWTVVEIQDKSVTVKWEEVREKLIMDDPTALSARVYEKTGNSVPSTPNLVTVATGNQSVPAPPAPQANTLPPQPASVSATGKKKCQINTPFGPNIVELDECPKQ